MTLSSEIRNKMTAFFCTGLVFGISSSILWESDVWWENEIVALVLFIVVILVVEYFVMKTSDKVARLEQELIKIREQSKTS